ncbi:recombinase family protein [Methylorubrum extorquens]|jgi:hypothetical protein|uniref:recombinase family protein n=1 Tax=Methylorubrum extorquens TaxID=408 RepID=UPI001EE4ED5F|nr:recombinase family protein [Methylorubrum extorquens]MCG5248213.1 recombinase family protein [Methylorubrum extorquens]
MANHLRNDGAGCPQNIPVPCFTVGPPPIGHPSGSDASEGRRGGNRSEAPGTRIGTVLDLGSPRCHVAIYVRCCGGDRQSRERRTAALLAYAEAHLPVFATVATFVDDGRAILPRSGLSRLLQEISAGKIDMILVERLDDLSRDPIDLELLFNAFERTGRGLLTPDGRVSREEIGVSALKARTYRDIRRRRRRTITRTVPSFTRAGVADASR